MSAIATGAPTVSGVRRLWDRELSHYPRTGQRVLNIAVIALATALFYFQLYVGGGVGTQLISHYHMSFAYYVNLNVIGLVLGGLASATAGISDRYGRANIVTVGLFLTAMFCIFGIPNAGTAFMFGVYITLIGMVEGVVLVATPALVRDFSPQVGRASAMGFWTIGPVLGSLIVSVVVTNTIDHLHAWQDEYIIAGIAGFGVFLIALFGLRELEPHLRDQMMVSERDRALVEVRAKGLDIKTALKHPVRQMMRLDIVGSSIAVSLLLIIYYIQVFFYPILLQTVFGLTSSRANSVGNWLWGFEAGALILSGFVSDAAKVRKPFMLVGAAGAIVFTILFISRITQPHTSYTTLVVLSVGIGVSFGFAYVPWMAGFTETVEKHNPALTATGLSVFGSTIRIVAALLLFLAPYLVKTVTTLIDKGPAVTASVAGQDPTLNATQNATVKAVAADPSIVTKVQGISGKYPAQLATAQKLKPATQAALAKNPNDPAAQAQAASDVSGVPVADVATVAKLSAQHPQALAAAAKVDPTTAAALITNPNDAAAAAKAVGEVATGLHVTPAQAVALLTELKSIPAAQLQLAATDGPKLQAAATQLKALAAVPASDLAFVGRWGPALQDPKTQAALKTLQVQGPIVQNAAKNSPKQWQHYFYIGLAGEIVFIPLIFLMTGFWDPRKARKQQREHEAWVEAELAKLASPGPSSPVGV